MHWTGKVLILGEVQLDLFELLGLGFGIRFFAVLSFSLMLRILQLKLKRCYICGGIMPVLLVI